MNKQTNKCYLSNGDTHHRKYHEAHLKRGGEGSPRGTDEGLCCNDSTDIKGVKEIRWLGVRRRVFLLLFCTTRTFCATDGSAQWLMGSCQKGPGVRLKGFPRTNFRTTWPTKRGIMAMDYYITNMYLFSILFLKKNEWINSNTPKNGRGRRKNPFSTEKHQLI